MDGWMDGWMDFVFYLYLDDLLSALCIRIGCEGINLFI